MKIEIFLWLFVSIAGCIGLWLIDRRHRKMNADRVRRIADLEHKLNTAILPLTKKFSEMPVAVESSENVYAGGLAASKHSKLADRGLFMKMTDLTFEDMETYDIESFIYSQTEGSVHQLCGCFQGKWGYYRCSSVMARKIRDLHRWYWQSVFAFHQWHRWDAKLTMNRYRQIWGKTDLGASYPLRKEFLAEPRLCPVFVANMPSTVITDNIITSGALGRAKGEPARRRRTQHFKKKLLYDFIPTLHNLARKPSPCACRPINSETLFMVDNLHKQAKEWFDNQ